jgi:hypothetical protein
VDFHILNEKFSRSDYFRIADALLKSMHVRRP